MKAILMGIFGLFVGLSAYGAEFDHSHKEWGWILSNYQATDGKVYYAKLKADLVNGKANRFTSYLTQLEGVTEQQYSGWKESERLAFLVNAYNALTVKLIVDKYPVKSIRKIGGMFSSPWKKSFFSLIGGKIKTLDAIEHEYLRKQFNFPQVHAAINCASISCPKLQREPFTGDKITLQLESAFREFLTDPSRNRYDPANGKLYLSEIFKWFGDDFQSKYGGFLKAIERFGPPSAKEAIAKGGKLEWIDYDWSLNDAG